MSQIPYRPDIDGLRALAVLSVLFYHAGWGLLPGGFMGVDIFFVISGFLITSFIVRDIRAGTFSMVSFWERRARRILPPLFVVVTATLIGGWILFLPFDLVQLGKEMASQAVFSSNLLFMTQGGYFDDGDQFKALLHTWSLAVEEQFYLFFPIGMALFARFIGRPFFYLILPAALLSFALCLYASGLSQRLAFYALPFRGWELLAGAMVALAAPPILHPVVRNIIATGGLFLMLLAIFFYKTQYAFPGWVTLLPVAGASLFIWANGAGATLCGRLLSWKPVVGIGLISYSLYLWHWPVLIFARYIPVLDGAIVVPIACLLLSTMLAVLTWRFVEQPVRHKLYFSTRRSLFLFSGAGLLAMAVLGLWIVTAKGMNWRFSTEVAAYAAARTDENPHRYECDQPSLSRIHRGDICQTRPEYGKPSFVVWGDSYADAIAPAFYVQSEKHHQNGYLVTGHGCPPILGADIKMPLRSFDCLASNHAVIKMIERENIRSVFLVGNWDSYLLPGALTFEDRAWFENDYAARLEQIELAGLQRTVDILGKAGVQNIYVMMNVPYTKFDPPRALGLAVHYGQPLPFVAFDEYQAGLAGGIEKFRAQSGDASITYINPASMLCDGVKCFAAKDGRSLYFNPGHLSAYGAEYLSSLFDPYFE